ncbi:MAG TPA: carbamoyl-phosphate synthase small subunit [bacterium]|nr:carbamoyl-phosphate synthase small subunit [bacterium]
MQAVLLLEDGTRFEGDGFGASATAVGEVVFNTGMTGYQEILTDPSYKGQMVTMTCSHIGNYGINEEDVESGSPQAEGFIVRELSKTPSNYRATEPLDAYLKRHGIPGIEGIDTRRLTRHIRSAGSMMGILSTETQDTGTLRQKLDAYPPIEGRDLVQTVTRNSEEIWKVPAEEAWYYHKPKTDSERVFHVVAYDFGIKHNILRLLTSFGMRVTVVPAMTSVKRVRALKPDGIFLSNGPGDPAAVKYAIENIRILVREYPLFGICLGHQLLALALGGQTYKLRFGHHGSNHPVKNLKTGKIEITAQNHNFAVGPESLGTTGLEVTHLNLNDGTIEGLRHRELPAFSVQCHPEASPGPHDSLYLFEQFRKMME